MPGTPAYLHGQLTSEINAAAIAVHKEIGPGFLESIYEEALCVELDRRGLRYERQLPVRVRYQGIPVDLDRLDLVVDKNVVVEVKAVETIHEAHLAVALAYRKATSLSVGLVINFADSLMRSRRVFRGSQGLKEEKNFRSKEEDGVLLRPTIIGHKNVPDDVEATIQSQKPRRLPVQRFGLRNSAVCNW